MLLIKLRDALGATLANMPVAELVFASIAVCFVLWGLSDVLGFIRYDGKRSTVVTAGAGKIALGAVALAMLTPYVWPSI
ncbi:hypothetical protein [Bosea sp. PAMC 26642]|uniref:hypothetical protein n=1 Tax=Bosea sp. (strain PAMC 26642) TaxID=1792307 RepID=UPI0007704CFB|nr:hypothetical protein [Bosea sp. PAMC 26642]AMJ61063.1 hypothetical protein AXW83_12875 [Bosea sp. PAMC 26642]